MLKATGESGEREREREKGKKEKKIYFALKWDVSQWFLTHLFSLFVLLYSQNLLPYFFASVLCFAFLSVFFHRSYFHIYLFFIYFVLFCFGWKSTKPLLILFFC